MVRVRILIVNRKTKIDFWRWGFWLFGCKRKFKMFNQDYRLKLYYDVISHSNKFGFSQVVKTASAVLVLLLFFNDEKSNQKRYCDQSQE